ncbi:SH3 domain-containing protein [Celeribacter halophilus]|uniref:SH3 domain-containing protein n=1 Tax=Celeribacter halophilus TaxID=576117 RepID=A0A1I3PYZ0_9RHOB|nr:SH3 domain-containing protein [Celeribacter halophilus]PZX13986.1 SH3 domain-containing protein [Celeribacter halophilus]SFJ26888.1 SH3 domain-containing protein [Celeribacter halophilus]
MKFIPKTLFATALSGLLVSAPVAGFAQNKHAIQQQAQVAFYVKPGVTLNARSGPGTKFGKIAAFKPGTKLSVVKRQGKWAQVRTDAGKLLWVFASYLTDTAPKVQKVSPAQHVSKPHRP